MVMRVGDLIEYQSTRWRVTKLVRLTRLATVVGLDGKSKEIPDNLDTGEPNECKVISHPATTWPTLTVPFRKGAGKVVKLWVPSMRSPPILLREGYDWVSSDAAREGGSIFLNPSVDIKTGDVLLAEYLDGNKVRVTIRNTLGTVAQKKARAAPKEVAEPTVYDRILSQDDD